MAGNQSKGVVIRQSGGGNCDKNSFYLCANDRCFHFSPAQRRPAAIADTSYLFHIVNGFLEESGKTPAFHVRLVGITDNVKISNRLFHIRPDVLLGDVAYTDLVI